MRCILICIFVCDFWASCRLGTPAQQLRVLLRSLESRVWVRLESTAGKDLSVSELADEMATEFSKANGECKYREGSVGRIFNSCFVGKSCGVRAIQRGVRHKVSYGHKLSAKARKS